MGSMQTWRKAYGALKDQTTVGLAHVNSDFKDVDVAIVKATDHVEFPPKERHIRKILGYTSAIRRRADVQYCLHALARRLAKTRNWTDSIKYLNEIHKNVSDQKVIVMHMMKTYLNAFRESEDLKKKKEEFEQFYGGNFEFAESSKTNEKTTEDEDNADEDK